MPQSLNTISRRTIFQNTKLILYLIKLHNLKRMTSMISMRKTQTLIACLSQLSSNTTQNLSRDRLWEASKAKKLKQGELGPKESVTGEQPTKNLQG